jgi:hypothetical protein
MTAENRPRKSDAVQRHDFLLASPKARTLLATIAQHRYSIANSNVTTPTYASVIDRPEVLQIIAGETLSGWDYRLTVAEDELARFEGDIAGIARDLLAGSAAEWWWKPLDRSRQSMVADDIDAVLGQIDGLAAEHATRHAIGLMASTSTWLSDDLPAAQLADPGFVARRRSDTRCWSVSVRPDARVFEVRTAADYVRLCENYPVDVATPPSWRARGVTTDHTVLPDWAAIAADWDGVHLSVSGQLDATGIPIRVDTRTALWLEADSEMTLWFSNVLEVDQELASVGEITSRW